jgi:hypothetical protein
MPQELNLSLPDAPLSIAVLLLNLFVGVVLALALRVHFRLFGSTLSNREEFAQVFPFVLLTTILIITVVKSSLALSLGLVGALSIVRFRTPIKEPEELAYLFIAIAMGLGLGANQTVPTIVASVFILVAMAAIGRMRKQRAGKNIYLSVDMTTTDPNGSSGCLERLNEIVTRHARNSDLRRYDVRQDAIEATYFVDIATTDGLSALVGDLRQAFPAAGITFLDQSQLPSV